MDIFDILRHLQDTANKSQKMLATLRDEQDGLEPSQAGMSHADYTIAITSWQGRLSQVIETRQWIISGML
jgi:uncharacterized protein YukE